MGMFTWNTLSISRVLVPVVTNVIKFVVMAGTVTGIQTMPRIHGFNLNSWIRWFHRRDTLKSVGHGSIHLLQWKVEGSKNGQDWKQINNQNCQYLNGKYVTKTFRCESSNVGRFYRFIRLTQTGANSGNSHYLILCNIKFYGALRSSQSH
jgi:hypothetical protein